MSQLEGLRTPRRSLLSGGLAAIAAVALAPRLAAAAEQACCPSQVVAQAGPPAPLSLTDLTAGNKQAAALAQRSARVMAVNEAVMAMADALADPTMRAKTVGILKNPAPTYQLKSPTLADKNDVRQELLAAGLITDQVTVEGIFPPVADATQTPQPFWSAPGSTYAGHHSYPGGLATHEWTNASLAAQFVTSYDARYGLVSESGAIDPSMAQAAPLWHDIMKPTVFQWHADGSEIVEQTIADTGGHHPLSGAEAIVRGLPADFVVALLGAHDPPQLGTSYQRLVNYIRAAAIVARVDPVAAGLLAPSTAPGMPAGLALAQVPARVEPHINHLSDHDFVFSGDSAALVIAALQSLAPGYGIDPPTQTTRFNWFRNTVLSQLTDMRLYGYLQAGGNGAIKAQIDGNVDLSGLPAT
ncbi:MAG TPA: metal-dependent phosphohydrolase [Chloroflexota bacterium]|nr:metal-dependent phosphohydrolase [Chloroflexota bacterium]